jgi:hypothetical protein
MLFQSNNHDLFFTKKREKYVSHCLFQSEGPLVCIHECFYDFFICTHCPSSHVPLSIRLPQFRSSTRVLAVDALGLALTVVRRRCAADSPHLDPSAAAAAASAAASKQSLASAGAGAKSRGSGSSGSSGSGSGGSGSGSGLSGKEVVVPGAGWLVSSLYECLSVICRAADGSWVALKVAGLVRVAALLFAPLTVLVYFSPRLLLTHSFSLSLSFSFSFTLSPCSLLSRSLLAVSLGRALSLSLLALSLALSCSLCSSFLITSAHCTRFCSVLHTCATLRTRTARAATTTTPITRLRRKPPNPRVRPPSDPLRPPLRRCCWSSTSCSSRPCSNPRSRAMKCRRIRRRARPRVQVSIMDHGQ